MSLLTFLGRRWAWEGSPRGAMTVQVVRLRAARAIDRAPSVVSLSRSPAPPGGSERRPGA
jgi:hypothetical protein